MGNWGRVTAPATARSRNQQSSRLGRSVRSTDDTGDPGGTPTGCEGCSSEGEIPQKQANRGLGPLAPTLAHS